MLVNAILDNEIIASNLILYFGEYMHGLFITTNPTFYNISPNNLIIYEAALWGLRNNKKLFHLGGGRSSSLDDSLFKYKTNFSPNVFKYYVSKTIRMPEIYNLLCDKVLNEENEVELFPKYRYIR